jgi:hypothetical protein
MTEEDINRTVTVKFEALENSLKERIDQTIAEGLKSQIKQKEYLEERQKLDLARFASSSQWLIASLLAVNTAGAVFGGGQEDLTHGETICVMIPFLLGVVLALFSGFFYRRATIWHVREAALVVGGKAQKRPRLFRGQDSDSRSEIKSAAETWDKLTETLGWLSFASFLAGVWFAYRILI